MAPATAKAPPATPTIRRSPRRRGGGGSRRLSSCAWVLASVGINILRDILRDGGRRDRIGHRPGLSRPMSYYRPGNGTTPARSARRIDLVDPAYAGRQRRDRPPLRTTP